MRSGRVAVVAGVRTPFARQGTAFRDMTARELGQTVVKELLARAEIHPRDVDAVVFGQTAPTTNIARDIVLGSNLPASVEAFTVVRGCATSFQSATSAAEAILAGQHDVVVVGGVDSTVPSTLVSRLFDKVRALGPHDPEPTMGEHAERMAKEAGISREEQDRFAKRSHVLAEAAWARGLFDAEVMHVLPPPSFDHPLAKDDLVLSRPESLGDMAPAFDRAHGTITSGNSAVPGDGASALLLMHEEKARALGQTPLGFLRSWAYAALVPTDLLGPAHATPIALDRAGLRLADVDVVDIHEASAAQVICNRKALASRRFAEDHLGRTSGAVGEIDDSRLNVHGGAIALGHPAGATGARMIHTVLRELVRRRGKYGLVTTNAAGGLGAAILLEAA
jgi:acetyl-CoA acyltransferase